MDSAVLLARCSRTVSRIGLGLAAVARPGYITLGRYRDLPDERSPQALYGRCAELLDAAVDLGVSYFDVARSYGRAEEFLARWLASRSVGRETVTIGSKWGYEYTADWKVDADVHEQKELSQQRFRRQLSESLAILGEPIDLYQIHSATLESGVLDDESLLEQLVDARRRSQVRAIGLTLSGPGSERTLRRALEIRVGHEPVFDVVQATYNILEPSLAPSLARARDAGLGVIAKEVHANGRLTPHNDRREDRARIGRLGEIASREGMTIDQLAVAFVANTSSVHVVNSGAATVEQLRSHVDAPTRLDPQVMKELSEVAQAPDEYWSTRSALPWN